MEKIGLEAILEMVNFNKGKKLYNEGLTDMTGHTEKSASIFSKLGGVLEGMAKVGIGAAVAGIGALTAVIVDSVGEAAAAQEAEAQLDAVLRSTGAAAAESAKAWEAAQGKTVTSTRLSAAAIADLTSKLEDQKLKHNTLGAAIQEQQQKVIQLTQQYGEQGLATLKAKARLAEMKNQYDDQGKSIDTLTDKIAKGGEKISVSLADKLGLVPPVVQMTKDEIINLADALSKVTPFEDDLIVSTEAVLLQFKSLGKDVFPQATELALDLAQRLGIDAVSAAKMLGKALVEPGEGLARLKQAGVTFSDEQEKMITKMVESGNVAGAQKLIMDELEKSIGGAARAAGDTFAGKMTILQNQIGNVKEAIGAAFLPVLTELVGKFSEFVSNNAPQIEAFFQGIADWIVNKAIPAILELYNWFSINLPPVIQYLSDLWINTLQPALAAVWNFLSTNIIPILVELWKWEAEMLPVAIQFLSDLWTNTLQPALQTIWTFITTSLIPAITEIYNWLATNLPPAIQTLSDFWTGTLQPALQAVWDFISTNIIPIFQTVAGWFTGEGTSSVMGWVDTISGFLGPIIQFAYDQFSFIVDWVKENWPLIQRTVETVMEAVREKIDTVLAVVKRIVETVLSAIQSFWEEHGDRIMDIVRSVWDIIKTTVETVIRAVAGIIKAVMQIINGDWSGAWETIKGVLQTVWDGIKKIINDAITIIKNELAIAWDLIKDAVAKAWEAVKQTLATGWENIKQVFRDAQETLKNIWDTLWTAIRDAAQKKMDDLLWALGGWIVQIYDTFKKWLGTFWAMGEQIIDGIIKGINDNFRRVRETFEDWIGRLIGWIKKLLGLGSPSRLFAEMGEQVMAGLAMGLGEGFKIPVNATLQTSDLKNSLNQLLESNLSMGIGGISRQAMTPAYAGTNQNVNVSFGDTTINSGLDAAAFQAQVLQTVTRAVRGY